MPFLSPAIPARRASQNTISPLETSVLSLPPLHDEYLNSLAPSFDAPISRGDSDDSDDETFVENMQGSVTFLPGGMNVPLPKACGALFAPNGQLLLYKPPKLSPASARQTIPTDAQDTSQHNDKLHKIVRLFPTFGNLNGGLYDSNEDSDSGSSSPTDNGKADANGVQPMFTFQSSSVPNHQSWDYLPRQTKPGLGNSQSQHEVIISIHQLDDAPELYSTRANLAAKYRVICEDGESRADVCDHNAAAVAESPGWRMLGVYGDC